MKSLIVASAIIVLLTGCFAGPPLVEITQGGSTVTSGQVLSLEAALAAPDVPDNFTFQWLVDDALVSGASSADFLYTAPVVSQVTSVKIKVTALAAGRGSTEAEITVSVLPSRVTHLSQSGSFTYAVDLGINPLSVYFIFSNGSETEASRPLVSPNFSVSRQLPPPQSSGVLPPVGAPLPAAFRGSPFVSEFNRNPPRLETFSADLRRSIEFPAPDVPLYDTEGEGGTLYDRSIAVASTCRKVVEADGKRLNIWVADADWGVAAGKVTQTMVDALATRFMKAGAGNDIYDWVRGIFGAEWGSHDYSNLIQPDNEVTILLYDISGDGPPVSGEGRIVGLFDAINNFTKASQSLSNERLMFFVDAPLFADDTDENGSWSITEDFWPNEVIATLAHEFQHMIHFYQKAVRNSLGISSEIWLNEMCSMAAEDLVSNKIQADGPRGVSYSDGTAGAPGNTSDRLARYNYYNDSSLTYWPPIDAPPVETLTHYSLSYSFGAYLARNYNGPELFKAIVQNTGIDYRAVTSALSAMGYGVKFTGLLQRWGASVLVSDMTDAADYYNYNSGDFLSFSHDGITYQAGSINLYNYYFNASGEQQSGPKLYSSSPVGASTLAPASNTFYYAGGGLTGTKSWTITIPASVGTTVVFR
ncbi:MAG: hypothetical protein JEZ04_08535 [Spirochaetales bacterium]|nr:hypothetical protein [Spirochaetales bacterium]